MDENNDDHRRTDNWKTRLEQTELSENDYAIMHEHRKSMLNGGMEFVGFNLLLLFIDYLVSSIAGSDSAYFVCMIGLHTIGNIIIMLYFWKKERYRMYGFLIGGLVCVMIIGTCTGGLRC